MKKFILQACVVLGVSQVAPSYAFAQVDEPPAESKDEGVRRDKPLLTFEPVLLDSDDGDATLGAAYRFKATAQIAKLGRDSPDFGDIDDPFGAIEMRIESTGTITASARDNPKNFLDAVAGVDGTYFFGRTFGWLSFGGEVAFETDQRFDRQQTVFGGRATWLKDSLLVRNDVLVVDAGYGRVDPSEEDVDRKAALGVTELDSFDRINLEALYMLPTGWSVVRMLEFNYRLYSEVDAPVAISAANLDTFELATVRAKLPNDLFIAYSTGRLPFDQRNSQIVEIGFSYKLF